MNTSAQKIMLVAGGTGGHVFPAVALAHELTQQGMNVSFITDRRGQRYVATDKIEDPPKLIYGRVMPFVGIRSIVDAILIAACNPISSASPETAKITK